MGWLVGFAVGLLVGSKYKLRSETLKTPSNQVNRDENLLKPGVGWLLVGLEVG